MTSRLLPLAFAAALLAGCERGPAPAGQPGPDADRDAATTPTVDHTFGPEISTEDLAAHIRTLSSDAFEGRAPGGRGEQLTVDYIADQFRRLGLEPGNGDSYFQTVPMVESTASSATTLSIAWPGGEAQTLAFGTDMVLGTSSGQPQVLIENSDMVFVGYGVNAPEADWNDYAGLDVRGKTVVMLVNDPGFASGDPALFQGRRMTYYGRWSYKFEEAARQGAAAALVIHDTPGAGYGWEVVQNSWSGKQFDLPIAVDPAPRLPAQGWLSGEAAATLFARSGLDIAQLRAAAGQRGFKPVPLGATLSTELNSTIRDGESRNVMALLRGSERPDEAIVYMAHWDHLGRNEELAGDQIFNGAVDNATGVAGVLEIAERYVTAPPPARSVLFMAVTLEESGLLGSKFYVAQPTIPLDNTVAAVNIDALQPIGRTRDMVVVGLGNSELEDVLRPVAAEQGRTLKVESAPEKGFYYRSDHFNFAKAGVPALYTKGGSDHVEKGEAYGLEWARAYGAERYHSPRDEFDPSWDLTGMVDDFNALYRVGRQLVDGDAWPNWYEGNEFRAVRDAALQQKAGRTPAH